MSEGLHLETGSQKFKMAAQTGCTYISTSMQDSKEIPTAICMFSESENSVALLVMLYLETGSQKFKTAAAKAGCTFNSASVQESKQIHTVICMFSCWETQWRYQKDSVSKPEVRNSRRRQFINDVYHACNFE
jgi:hypothetical protein